jgi:hypothetical protein
MKLFLLILVVIGLSAIVLALGAHPFAAASDKVTAETLKWMEAEFMRAAQVKKS